MEQMVPNAMSAAIHLVSMMQNVAPFGFMVG